MIHVFVRKSHFNVRMALALVKDPYEEMQWQLRTLYLQRIYKRPFQLPITDMPSNCLEPSTSASATTKTVWILGIISCTWKLTWHTNVF